MIRHFRVQKFIEHWSRSSPSVSLTCSFNNFPSRADFSFFSSPQRRRSTRQRRLRDERQGETEGTDESLYSGKEKGGGQLYIRGHVTMQRAGSLLNDSQTGPTIDSRVYRFFIIPLWKQQHLTDTGEHRGSKYLIPEEGHWNFTPGCFRDPLFFHGSKSIS